MAEAPIDTEALEKVRRAMRCTKEFPHPMVLVKASTMVAEGKLRVMEDLRNENKLTFLDLEMEIESFKEENHIAFMSHQWLGWHAPDEDNVHYDAIIFALHGIKDHLQMDFEHIFVWVDYCSIPQRHKGQQQLAISSLPAYARLSHCMVVICPEAKHTNLQSVCNFQTYQTRGWCRAEVFAKICGTGVENTFVVRSVAADDPENLAMEPVNTDDDWVANALRVFNGKFTCCSRGIEHGECDVEKLVMPALELYYSVLQQQDKPSLKNFANLMIKDKDALFPKSFEFGHGGRDHNNLFGELITLLESEARTGLTKDQSLTPTTGF